MTGVVILGAGGHGIDVASIASAAGHPVLGYLDDNVTDDTVLGPLSQVAGYSYLFGINNSSAREELDPGDGAVTAIHPSASVWHDVVTSPGVVVGANTTLGPDVRLGRHTHINGNAFLTRAHLGDFVTVGPGVTVCGHVLIGAGSMIGAGATISNLCEIGPRAVIGAGAVIKPRTVIPPNTTWVGVPARQVTQ